MKHYALCLTLLLSTPLAATAAEPLQWPAGQRAAVSLSYDDALDSQLDGAVPVLNQHNLRASFYLTLAAPALNQRLNDWRAVAQAGHELGNHTLFHACSAKGPGREWVPAHNDLDKRSVKQMQQEVATANTFLKAIDGRDERTLTPPCLDADAADGNYVEAVRDQFVAIKGAEQNLPVGFTSLLMPDGHTSKQLIEFVKAAAERGGLANIIFHGMEADHLAVSRKDHAEFIKYLADNRDVYWTDSYVNIMKHVNNETAKAQSEQ